MTVVSGSKETTAVAKTEPRLAVWQTVVDAYALTFSNFGYLLRISWAWVLLMTPVSLVFYSCMRWLDWQHSASEDLLGTLLFQPLLASVAVAWHRRLLADEVWPGLVYIRLDGLVARYLVLAVVISVLSLGPMLAISSDVEAEWDVLLLVTAAVMTGAGPFVSTKIWLALPARALGNSEITVRQAWRGSRGNFWRLIAGAALSSLAVVVLLVPTIFEPNWDEVSQPLFYAVWQAPIEGITFLAGMPMVSFLSLAYRRLIQDRDPVDDSARHD